MRIGGEMISWILGGALLASTGVNAMLYRSQAEAPQAGGACGMPNCAPFSFDGDSEQTCEALKRLSLTSDQKAELTSCCGSNCCSEMVGLGQSLDEKLGQLESALRDRPTDVDQVEALTDEISNLWVRQFKATVHSTLKVRETLSHNQLQILLGHPPDALGED